MNVTIPGALADYLNERFLSDDETRDALDTARRGRGRTLVIKPTSTRVLHFISRYAEHILDMGRAHTRAQRDAARLWIARAGKAPAVMVHTFESTQQAYNATQCRDDVRDGDVLAIPSEGVVGFLRSAWPAAITAKTGELHGIIGDPRTIDGGDYVASVDRAEAVARELGAALAERPKPVIVRADEVRRGDVVLGCYADEATVNEATVEAATLHSDPYTAAPHPYRPDCGCLGCEQVRDHGGDLVTLADLDTTPWGTCDPCPVAAPVLIIRATEAVKDTAETGTPVATGEDTKAPETTALVGRSFRFANRRYRTHNPTGRELPGYWAVSPVQRTASDPITSLVSGAASEADAFRLACERLRPSLVLTCLPPVYTQDEDDPYFPEPTGPGWVYRWIAGLGLLYEDGTPRAHLSRLEGETIEVTVVDERHRPTHRIYGTWRFMETAAAAARSHILTGRTP
ncbi:hypothetical protein [Streptomyces sp. CH6]|uniref:hypothetical protein n=1 Tax=unclassified Streptomyces TaxID=2593676 RepID=UPI003CFBE237